MIVNLYDSRGLAGDWQYTTPGPHILRVVAGRNESLGNIIRRVIQQSEGVQSIWLLRIIAHGNTGFVQLGSDNLTLTNVNEFRALRNYFTSNGIGIAIHSCGSASSTSICGPLNWFQKIRSGNNACRIIPGTENRNGGRGSNFLRGMSQASCITVRGGLNAQSPDSRFRFEGPSIAVSNLGVTFFVSDEGRWAYDTTRIVR